MSGFWFTELEDDEMNYTGLWGVYQQGRYVTQYAERAKAERCVKLLNAREERAARNDPPSHIQAILDQLTAEIREKTGNDNLTVVYDTRPIITVP